MEKEEYKKMYDLESTYWWYVGRRFIIQNFLEKFGRQHHKRILDVGCGTGINLGLLAKFGDRVTGIDMSEDALSYCRLRGFLSINKMVDEYQFGLEEKTIDMVSMLDVLEHVEDEDRMLAEAKRVLVPGGHLLVTVPAYQFLWSEHDVALHHRRRYTRSGLEQVLKRNGLKVLRTSYCITFSFPIIVCYRILKGIFNRFWQGVPTTSHVILPGFVNKIFITFLKIESLFLRYAPLPFGTSIIVLSEKTKP